MGYDLLNHQVNQLARHLQRLGAQPNIGIGGCLEPSLQLTMVILAIQKIGATYISINPCQSPAHIARMIETSDLSILVTQQSHWDSLPASQAKLVFLDLDAAAIAQQSGEELTPFPPQNSHLLDARQSSSLSLNSKIIGFDQRLNALENYLGLG